MLRARSGLVLALAATVPGLAGLAGCERQRTETPDVAPEPDPATASNGEAEAEAESETPPTDFGEHCGPVGERFNNLGWLPRKAKFVALVDLEAPVDERSAAAQKIAALDEDAALAIPVFAQFELDSLGLGTTSVTTLLAQIGLAPHDLLKVTTPSGLPLWVLPSTCDLDELSARLRQSWQVTLRNAVDGRVGTVPDDAPLPFDVLLLPGDRVTLVPRGHHAQARAWLASGHQGTNAARGGEAGSIVSDPSEGNGDNGDNEPTAIATVLSALAPATFRVVFAGRSLIDPDSPMVREDASTPVTIRATADGIWVDGEPR